MHIFCLDLWDKRVGTAYSVEGISCVWEVIARTQVFSYIRKYLQTQKIDTIVVGLPYDLYGKNIKQLEKTQRFLEKLQQSFPDIICVGHDERYSSFVASEYISWHRDDIAAQVILESYLASSKEFL